jgi:DNA invertase Pin-like site-specific DNA recombinase
VADRLGRSLQELVSFLGELHAKGVDLYLHQQGLDTGTPAGRAMFQMLGVFAEFERGIIVERVKSGLSRAQSQGKRLGRRRVGENVVECIREQLATGAGILRPAKKPRSTAIFDQWSRSTACPTLAQAKRVLAQPVSKGTLISGSERLWRNIQVPSMLRCSLSAL